MPRIFNLHVISQIYIFSVQVIMKMSFGISWQVKTKSETFISTLSHIPFYPCVAKYIKGQGKKDGSKKQLVKLTSCPCHGYSYISWYQLGKKMRGGGSRHQGQADEDNTILRRFTSENVVSGTHTLKNAQDGFSSSFQLKPVISVSLIVFGHLGHFQPLAIFSD